MTSEHGLAQSDEIADAGYAGLSYDFPDAKEPSPMEMQQIRYFLSLAETLNFRRAAEECNVSQPALTRAIQALEAELGGELIRREHSNSHLTELGKRMLPLMQRCFDSALTAKALAKSIAKDDVTPLAVAVSDSVNVETIMAPIAEMFRAFPGLQLKLTHGGGADVLESLKEGEVEIAVAGPLPDDWERLDHWPLFVEGFEAATGEDNPLSRENELTLAKLSGAQLFRLSGCEMVEAISKAAEAQGLSLAAMHDVAAYHDLMALVGSGVGAAIVPQSAPRSERVRRAPITDLGLTRTVSVYAVAGRKRGPAAAAFLNLLRASEFAAA